MHAGERASSKEISEWAQRVVACQWIIEWWSDIEVETGCIGVDGRGGRDGDEETA